MKSAPLLATAALAVVALSSCSSRGSILVAGDAFATDAAVINWTDEGGYDGQQEACWFVQDRILPTRPVRGCDTPRRYSTRKLGGLDDEISARVKAEGWTLELLRERVDQVVVHFDVCGCSKQCFKVLHDVRGLSCHFLLDVDGTVYQTLDLAARARHATIANDRSIGIEIAQIGAYPDMKVLDRWYARDPDQRLRVTFPASLGDPGVRTRGFVARPSRNVLLLGPQNGRDLMQYDFTEEQYVSLERLLRSLREIFPNIEARVPRRADGTVPTDALSPAEFAAFRGVLGHHHVQTNKNDPGPAFDWERIARALRSR